MHLVSIIRFKAKKGKYEFEINNGSDVIAVGQILEIKKKGMSEVNLFG